MTVLPESAWDEFLAQVPDAHLLQTGPWGEFKSRFGWQPLRVVVGRDAESSVGTQILIRSLPLGFRMAYIPKGPVSIKSGKSNLSMFRDLWEELDILLKKENISFLVVEPDLLETPRGRSRQEITTLPVASYYVPDNLYQDGETQNIPNGFIFGQKNYQPRRTILVSLNGDEERILGRMKQKARYNVRLALKKGVIVRPCSDYELFYNLAEETSTRDAFAIHDREYYKQAYEIFHPRGMCEFLLAEYQGEPLAALMVFAHGKRAWYFYGASANIHRERMPTYLLQWEAMRWAKSIGCTEYDLWGVPDEDEDVLEDNFTDRSDGLWGVYRFKRGFGGRLYRAVGSWDRVYNQLVYTAYRYIYAR